MKIPIPGMFRSRTKCIKLFSLAGGFLFLALGCQGCFNPGPQFLSEDFSKPLKARDGLRFGEDGWLTLELTRKGTFIIDGSGEAWQRSDSYQDAAIIRSTKRLPKTYTIEAVVGQIQYDLFNIGGLHSDPKDADGPMNENGCYLLAIADTAPRGHYANGWWHLHRKVVIDVDNNIWGSGMPHPIFMVYFDRNNELVSWNGLMWNRAWRKAVEYKPEQWYIITIQRTNTQYILRIADANQEVLAQAAVSLEKVWHADENSPDYLVVGDPHENYYQGSMKIRSISLLTP